jgi:signal peptidase II
VWPLALWGLLAAGVVALDQRVKQAAVGRIGSTGDGLGTIIRPAMSPRVFAGPAGAWRTLLAVWCACAAALTAAAAAGLLPPLAQAGLVMAGAGAASNLIDLKRRGGVVDLFAIWRWPTFNLADVAITAGVALAVAGLVV